MTSSIDPIVKIELEPGPMQRLWIQCKAWHALIENEIKKVFIQYDLFKTAKNNMIRANLELAFSVQVSTFHNSVTSA